MLGETASWAVKLPCSQAGSERRSRTPGTFCHCERKERQREWEAGGGLLIGWQQELTSSFRPRLFQYKERSDFWLAVGVMVELSADYFLLRSHEGKVKKSGRTEENKQSLLFDLMFKFCFYSTFVTFGAEQVFCLFSLSWWVTKSLQVRPSHFVFAHIDCRR